MNSSANVVSSTFIVKAEVKIEADNVPSVSI